MNTRAIKTRVTPVLSILIFSISGAAVMADDETTLQAGVRTIEVAPYKKVLSDEIKQVRSGASSVDDEVNIQPVNVQISTALLAKDHSVMFDCVPCGPMAPPDKNALKKHMCRIKNTVDQLKQDNEAFDAGQQQLAVSQETIDNLKPVSDEWTSTVNAIDKEYQELEALADAKRCDNTAISQSAHNIIDECQILQNDLKQADRIVQKESKKH